MTHEPGIELAERLLATAPAGLTRVFYAGDGSSAVEAAIKMAFQAQAQRDDGAPARPLYLHVAEGYHGDTLGAVSVGGIDLFHATYRPILLETRMVSSPGLLAPGADRAARAAEVLAEMRAALDEAAGQVCAVVIEPLVQAAGGMLTHDVSFVRGVRALCDEFGALMVVDEVATGIGRTGRMWAVDHAGVTPDLLTCGKGLTGGYLPLSAVLAREEVYEAFLGAPAAGPHLLPRPHLHGQPAVLRGRHREPRPDGRARHRRARRPGRRADRRAHQGPRGVRRRARGPAGRHHDRHRGRVGRRAHRLRGLPGRPPARRVGAPAR